MGAFSDFNMDVLGNITPSPLLALSDENILLGGLAYKYWEVPNSIHTIGLWINAVLVKPEYRRQSIATSLI